MVEIVYEIYFYHETGCYSIPQEIMIRWLRLSKLARISPRNTAFLCFQHLEDVQFPKGNWRERVNLAKPK
jgi:hypothetical protein